jgi:hypothetical protein
VGFSDRDPSLLYASYLRLKDLAGTFLVRRLVAFRDKARIRIVR